MASMVRTRVASSRASNVAGRALYLRHGFAEIGLRRAYYPADAGREDAVTMEKKLS